MQPSHETAKVITNDFNCSMIKVQKGTMQQSAERITATGSESDRQQERQSLLKTMEYDDKPVGIVSYETTTFRLSSTSTSTAKTTIATATSKAKQQLQQQQQTFPYLGRWHFRSMKERERQQSTPTHSVSASILYRSDISQKDRGRGLESTAL